MNNKLNQLATKLQRTANKLQRKAIFIADNVADSIYNELWPWVQRNPNKNWETKAKELLKDYELSPVQVNEVLKDLHSEKYFDSPKDESEESRVVICKNCGNAMGYEKDAVRYEAQQPDAWQCGECSYITENEENPKIINN